MNYAITGANGFIGRALVRHLLSRQSDIQLTLADASFGNPDEEFTHDNRVNLIEGDLCDPAIRDSVVDEKTTVLYHLAALPGGSSEKNPTLSKAVNLDATLSLFELLGKKNQNKAAPRIVYASTIAVLGNDFPPEVDDAFKPAPTMTYGAHKAMVELALADMSRRKIVDGMSLRLPGIVARPKAPNGLKSAFMSDVFHSLLAHVPFESPVSESATMWLSSVSACVKNIAGAGFFPSSATPPSRAINLPVTHCSMDDLCNEIITQTGAPKSLLTYKADADLESQFGAYPPITTMAANALGFKSDGSLQNLVSQVIADITTDNN